MLLLSNKIHEKGISQRQGKRNFDTVRAIYNLYSCSSFAPVLHGFSQSEGRTFFVYIFRIGNNMIDRVQFDVNKHK